MKLVHMSGAGNVFLVGDVRTTSGTTVWEPSAIRSLIAEYPRQDGLPIEGVIFLTWTKDDERSGPDFAADFYNPDGTHGMMCGNGARCAVRFFRELGTGNWEHLFFLLNGVGYEAEINGETVSVHFPAPKEIRHFAPGELEGVRDDVWYVDVNSDHAVIDGPLDASRPIVQVLRHHPAFPRCANVNMVELIDRNHANIATFERGVEQITGACGTGALSSAIALYLSDKADSTITFTPPSGRQLTCTLTTFDGRRPSDVGRLTLTGDARFDSPFFEA